MRLGSEPQRPANTRRFLLTLAAVVAAASFACQARASGLGGLLEPISARAQVPKPLVVAAGTNLEVAFSPDGGAESLVLKVIDSAKREIRLQAYSFTSATVVKSLIQARRRGVDVKVVVDRRHNLDEDRSGRARAALSAIANAGVGTRTIDAYAIHHDKVVIVDGLHVQTGSFNFSGAAASRNSENVLVVWNEPRLARAYLAHWTNRWERGVEYRTRY